MRRSVLVGVEGVMVIEWQGRDREGRAKFEERQHDMSST